MSWDLLDFVVFGAMLATVGVTVTLAVRLTDSSAYRAAVGFAVAAAFILIWVNAAVGIIGNENNDANLMFFGVLAVGVAGAVIARFKPQGTARAMVATAFAQVLVAVIAIFGGMGPTGSSWPRGLLIVTAFFTALWLLSARLFQKAAGTQQSVAQPE